MPFGSRILLCWLMLGAASGLAAEIPTPESVLGHKPGDDFYLASYDDSLGYFRKLAAATDRLRLVQVGKTSEGRDWYVALISSAENLKNWSRYQEIARRVAAVRGLDDGEARRLAREGRAIVHIDGGLHATEVANAQHTILLGYKLVSGDADPAIRRILDEVILALWFSVNPDGQNMVVDWYRRNLGTPYEVSPLPWLYQKYVGHDNNRDGYMNNMIESQVVTRATLGEFHPMIYLCHHQTAPFPTRIWLPPFAEPISSNMPPLVTRWINLIGTGVAAYLEAHGMEGAVHGGTGFDDWYPGYNDAVNNFRHTMSFWTETALYRYATPHFYTVADFPKEFQDLRKQTLYSSPWKGGWWRLGDAVRYMIGASMGVLDTAARYREEIIYNRYQSGRDVIRRFSQEPPFAYLVPQRQHDPQTAALLLEKMQLNGIDISQAAAPFAANGREYPAGTWAILMDQPCALLVKELFEVQRYPDLREAPGGPPELPYDVAGWTLPLQMGVEVAAVTTPLAPDVRAKLRAIEKVAPPPGGVEGSGSAYLFDAQSNAAYRAVNRILGAGGSVGLTAKGRFVATGLGLDAMKRIAGDLALKFQASGRPDASTPLRAPRIGLYSSWVSNIDGGWTEWILEQHEFVVKPLHDADVRAGHLGDSFDVVILPEASKATILEGHKPGAIPGEFAGGLGDEGIEKLKEFVRAGGTLVTLGNASQLAIEELHLPVRNAVQGLKNEEFFCSGSVLRAEVREPAHPLVAGLAQRPAVFFARNGVFETGRDFRGSVLLGYPKDENPLLSGYLLHSEKMQGKAAALEVVYGSGHVVLTGFRPQWRGQTHGMYRFLFNALFYSGELARRTPAGGERRPGREAEWDRLAEAIRGDLEKVFAHGQKLAAARGAAAADEARRYDELVARFQAAYFAALDELKQGPVAVALPRKIDEYKAQLKAALVDIRAKDFTTVKLTLEELRLQFRLAELEREIGEIVKGR